MAATVSYENGFWVVTRSDARTFRLSKENDAISQLATDGHTIPKAQSMVAESRAMWRKQNGIQKPSQTTRIKSTKRGSWRMPATR